MSLYAVKLSELNVPTEFIVLSQLLQIHCLLRWQATAGGQLVTGRAIAAAELSTESMAASIFVCILCTYFYWLPFWRNKR